MSHANITIPITVKCEGELLSRLGPVDPWQLRDEFLSWPLDDWQDLIARVGNFGPSQSDNKEGFVQWQKLLRFALICPTRMWKGLGIDFQARVGFEWGGKTPQAFMIASSALEAIVFTIQIDKLRGAEFRVCARHDCKNPPFRVEARQKIFCSMDCAHLVAVRRSRAKSKATKKAPSGKRRG